MDPLISRLKELSLVVTQEMKLAPSDLEVKDLSQKFRGEVTGLYAAAFDFYGYARQRESVFYEKIDAVMGRNASSKAVLITGGFHTDGMTDLFREHNISYGVLTPRLMEKSDEKMYRSAMLQNEQQLFSISMLEMAAACQDPNTLKLMGVDFSRRITQLIANFQKVGHWTVEEAVAEFNAQMEAHGKNMRIISDGKDADGHPQFILRFGKEQRRFTYGPSDVSSRGEVSVARSESRTGPAAQAQREERELSRKLLRIASEKPVYGRRKLGWVMDVSALLGEMTAGERNALIRQIQAIKSQRYEGGNPNYYAEKFEKQKFRDGEENLFVLIEPGGTVAGYIDFDVSLRMCRRRI